MKITALVRTLLRGSILLITLLMGCRSMAFMSPHHPYDNFDSEKDKDLQAMKKTFLDDRKIVLEAYDISTRDEDRLALKDKFVRIHIDFYDYACWKFRSELYGISSATLSAGKVVSLGFSTAGALVTPVQTAKVFSGVSGAVLGSTESLKSQFFGDVAQYLVVGEMDKLRKQRLEIIFSKLRDKTYYPLSEVKADLDQYNEACTVMSAVSSLSTGATKTPSTPSCNYKYTDWGTCQADNAQTRTIVSITPAGCTGTPVTSRLCPPVVTGFTVPKTANTLTVPIDLTATDNVGIRGYMVTESEKEPAGNAAEWNSTKPASYTFATPGMKNLYAWALNAAGTVSASWNAKVNIILPAPAVTAFKIPETADTLLVNIDKFDAVDNVLPVAGFMVTESATAPAAKDTKWSPIRPMEFKFESSGDKTLYAWAKDAAGNVSASKIAKVTITLPK